MSPSPFHSDDRKSASHKLRPKDAATLILVRREKGTLRVLMGRRHQDMVFMAGKYVFPGGRIDPGDQRIAVADDLRPEVLAKLATEISPARARGLALAAVRETFEEAGVVVGKPAARLPRTRSEAWKQYFAQGVIPALGRFEFVARAITPPGRSRRFDARFFMADADTIAHVLDAAGSNELLEPCWLTLAEARALDLPRITRTVLDEVEVRTSDGADDTRPVPFFRVRHNKPGITYL